MAEHEHIVDRLSQRLDRLQRRAEYLLRLLSGVEAAPDSQSVLNSEEARAHAIVSIVAELEALVRETLKEVHRTINAEQIASSELSRCVRQLAAHAHFDSLRDSSRHDNIWTARAAVTSLDVDHRLVTLPLPMKGPQPPLDGRTLIPEHFRRIWSVYGLPGEPFPTASTATSLQKLALARNDIAHGNLPFEEALQEPGRELRHVRQYLADIRELAQHFIAAWSSYLEGEMYRIPKVPQQPT